MIYTMFLSRSLKQHGTVWSSGQTDRVVRQIIPKHTPHNSETRRHLKSKATDQGPFYLHVEAFDPHEPWDPPAEFLNKYLKTKTAHSWPEPPYTNVKVPEEGVTRLRANYAGEASNVDHWYGQVLATIRSLGLYDNSIIVFLADHGALLNEQGQWVKGPEKLRRQVTHVPLLVHLPNNQYAGKRISGFAQTAD